MATSALEQLTERAETLEAGDDAARFADRPGPKLLFLAGDPTRRPETHDVAVVLRDLLRRHEFALAITTDQELAAGFGARVVPSIVVFPERGEPQVIAGIKDWSVYEAAFAVPTADTTEVA